MIRGYGLASSGLFAGQRRQEVLTNNLTNLHTPGYKGDESIRRAFPEMLMHRIREGNPGLPLPPHIRRRASTPIGILPGAVYTHEIVPNFAPGPIQKTDNPFDVAIEADPVHLLEGRQAVLFFTVGDGAGNVLYTRDGKWTVDALGRLVTQNGNLVLDINGEPIQVGNQHIEIAPNGLITLTNPDTGVQQQVQLGLVAFEAFDPNEVDPDAMETGNLHQLAKEQNGYFRWNGDEDEQPEPIDPLDPAWAPWQFRVTQGALEGSNVDVTQTMTQMLENLRFFEANQRVLQATDRTVEKAVNEIGRV